MRRLAWIGLVGLVLAASASFVVVGVQNSFGEEDGEEIMVPEPADPGVAPCDYGQQGFCLSWTGQLYYDPTFEPGRKLWESCRYAALHGVQRLGCDGVGLVGPGDQEIDFSSPTPSSR